MQRNQQHGFTLMEVLISVLITAIGLLGLLGLQARAQQSQLENLQRGQAMLMIKDMISRISANPGARGCYAITTNANGTPYAGSDSTENFACNTFGNLATQTRARDDLQAWENQIDGEGEQLGGNAAGGLIGARGCVTRTLLDLNSDGTSEVENYRVSISWQGSFASFAPPAGSDCGNNLYGAETQRRTLSVSVYFADLTVI